MNRIWIVLLMCALSGGVALAQSTSQGSSSSTTQAQPQQSPQQSQPSGTQTTTPQQPQDQTSGGQPAGSDAQATSETSAQTQPQGQTSAPTRNAGGGGVPLVWVLIGIAVVLAIIFGLVGRGRSDSVVVDRTDRVERVDRDRAA